MPTVAIIGAGPAGLAAARYLTSQGFKPVIFERGRRIGGQWSGDPRCSGIWPSMRTNTSRILTAFSDFPYPSGTAVYPTNHEVSAYLGRYADTHGLTPHVRLETRVQRIVRGEGGSGWTVHSRTGNGPVNREHYTHVIVAAGRYQKPVIPDVPGLATFSGTGGIAHTNAYKDPDRFRGLRVLVAGCAISALEVASDLAMIGAARVVTTNRRQRYILPKLCAGVPTDHMAFSRFGGLAAALFPPDALAAAVKAFVIRTSGSPEQFGAPKPADDVFEAGISLSEHYLPLVAEGRIAIRPWLTAVSGRRVTFSDHSEEEFDAMIFGTGYELDLPFLDDRTRAGLEVGAEHIDLHKFTFHPDLPGLACLGLFHQMGPIFPVLELQARWVAYAWSGARPMPSDAEMRKGVEAYRARRHLPQGVPMHTTARIFAGEAGVEPDVTRWPDLVRPLLFGPLTPISYRLSGPDSLPDAAERVVRDASAFGAMPSTHLSPEQCTQLQTLAALTHDLDFAAFVSQITSRAAGIQLPERSQEFRSSRGVTSKIQTSPGS
jgi:dimethylaniline monooxygenase (N-oxide forming)